MKTAPLVVTCGRWPALLLVAVVLASSASLQAAEQPALAESACVQSLVVDEWKPPLALAGGKQDIALPALAELIDFQRVAIAATQPDKDVAALEHDLWSALRHFDLPRLYKTLPNEKASESAAWRSLDLKASLAGDRYRVVQIAPDSGRIDTLGDSLVHLGMRPKASEPDSPGGQHYTVRTRWQIGTGPLRWANLRQAQWLMLDRLVTPRAVAPPRQSLAAAGKANPRLSLVDNPIMGQLGTGFPATAAWYAGIARVDGLRGHGASIAGFQHLQLDLSLDAERLQKAYPAVADYMDRLGDVISAHIVVRNGQGQWLTFDMDSEKRRLVVDAWLRDGHLVPSRNGLPQANYRPGAPLDHASFESLATLRMKALGITVTLSKLPMQWRYERNDAGAHFDGWLHDKPEVSITGRALGLIPAGMMEGLLPVNVSDTVDDFLTVLTSSNEGRGAHATVDLSDAPGNNTVALAGNGDTLDNFFIHFGVLLINGRVLPSSAALAGLRSMLGDGLTAFDSDLKRRAGVTTVPDCASSRGA